MHFLRLHRALREFPRYSQFVDKAHSTSLTLAESHLLSEVSATRGLKAKDLSSLLMLDKIAISRLIAELTRRKLLRAEVDALDKRQKSLSLTPRGKQELAAFDRRANLLLTAFDEIARFGERERTDLQELLTLICDRLQIMDSPLRRGEHSMRPAVRRLARAFGLLGSRAQGTGFSVLQWQILLELCETNGGGSVSSLSALFKVSGSTLSQAVRVLISNRLIARRGSTEDRRSALLFPTPRARKLVAEIEREQEALYRKHLKRENMLARWVDCAERWIAASAIFFHTSAQGLEFRSLRADRELQAARQMAVFFFDPSQPLPGSLFSGSSVSFGLFAGHELKAAVELRGGRLINAVSVLDNADGLRSLVLLAMAPGQRLTVAPHLENFFSPSRGWDTSILASRVAALLA